MNSTKLSRTDLMSLEQYSSGRKDFRARVIAHKKQRIVGVGPNTTWCFEDALTIQYQVQEMLRVERIFEADGIQEELDTYTPLIPDGSNWKATLLIEFPDAEERKEKLAGLKSVEDKCWVQVEGFDRVNAIADEDLERENDEKTSAVHFLRFELSADMRAGAKAGASIAIGVGHPNYTHCETLSDAVRKSLIADLA